MEAFLSGWVSRYGVPGKIVSGRGPQFISQLWRGVASLLGMVLHQTTVYHPQANGLVERMLQQMKASLTARLDGTAWADQLPWVMLGIRTVHKDDLGASPAEMTFEVPLHLPGEFCGLTRALPAADQFLRDLRQATADLRPVPTSAHRPPAETHIPEALRTCPFIFVRRDGHRPPLQPKYDGPYPVLNRQPKFFRILLGEKEDTVSIDRLKPANVPEDNVPAIPRRRGRPRRQPAQPVDPPKAEGPQGTRAGRWVGKPDRYMDSVGGALWWSSAT